MPTGDLPRNMLCVVDRRLCCAVSPGSRVTAVGILSIFQSKEVRRGVQPAQPSCRGCSSRLDGALRGVLSSLECKGL